jgi:hypothetical protein
MREIRRRLPIEIQLLIYELSGSVGSLFRTQSVCMSHGQLALGPGSAGKTPSVTMFLLGGAGRIENLSASSTTILGEACLTKILWHMALPDQGSPDPLDVSIGIDNRPVWGIQAALSTYGVCGIRVLYLDGSRSPWLGSGRGKFFGAFECRDLGRLEVYSDVSGR